jgi:hypothetical protein
MNNSEYSPSVPAKRKRGRPRKDPTLIRLAIAPSPPGFQTPNGNQPREDPTDPVIGQPVTGVVEATFDAGYLLSVKIGNSSTRLRGVVFKPGHYTPVTPENDVAPHIQMIKRKDTNFRPGQSQTRTGLTQTPPSKKHSSAIVPAPSVPPLSARGTVIPVVLQPVNMSNGATMSEPKGVKTTTPGEVTKGLDGSSESSETQAEEREGGSDTSEPLFIEPLQTVHTHHTYNHLSASIPRTVDSNRTGRMTELLMAVQENMPENHFPRVEIPISGSTISFQQPRSTETNVGDENHRYRT